MNNQEFMVMLNDNLEAFQKNELTVVEMFEFYPILVETDNGEVEWRKGLDCVELVMIGNFQSSIAENLATVNYQKFVDFLENKTDELIKHLEKGSDAYGDLENFYNVLRCIFVEMWPCLNEKKEYGHMSYLSSVEANILDRLDKGKLCAV